MTTYGRDGEPVRVRVDIGVGVVHLLALHAEVEDVLDDAQRLAEAARHIRSRAAMADPVTGEILAVEQANFARPGQRLPEGGTVLPLHGNAR